jgi:phosphoglycerol transferase MdoB-like AlkP superfamily enzyme
VVKIHFRLFFWRWLKNLGILFLLFLLGQTLFRLGFSLYFGEWELLRENLSDLRYAFFLGLRYDLMPLAYINVLPFIFLHLAYFIPGKLTIRATRFLCVSFLTLGYLALIWLYVLDYSFYSYFQDHINILFYGLFEDDTGAVLISIWKNYNVIVWLTLILGSHYAIYRLVKVMFSSYDFDLKARRHSVFIIPSFLGGFLILALFARGNFSRLPLSVEDAEFSQIEFINEIALNGALTLNRAMKIRKVFGKGEYNYLSNYGFKSWEEAYEVFFGRAPEHPSLRKSLMRKTPYREDLEKKPPHVVMVVMESFGSYWNTLDGEKFNILGDLKDHLKSGYLFENFLPAENGTIGSMVSIATSQVIRPGSRFLSESAFMNTQLSSAVNIPYKDKGYDTHFVYGGKLGWRSLGKYLRNQGFDFLWGADEIKEAMPELMNFDPRDLGNEWGIYDEYLYLFMEEQLRTATRPQFFLVLTTTNHPPFEYPRTYKEKDLKISDDILGKLTVGEGLAHKRFLAFQYANQKIGEFLGRIKNSIIRDDVILALTGDHSYWISKGVGQDEEFRRFSVPFFISVPERLKTYVDTTRFGSHEDIFPTLYHLSLSNQNYIGLGENLLKDEGLALNSSGLVANKAGAYHHDSFWKWKDLKNQMMEETEATPELILLKRKKEALISLTDLYLKEEKDRTQTDEEDDPQ